MSFVMEKHDVLHDPKSLIFLHHCIISPFVEDSNAVGPNTQSLEMFCNVSRFSFLSTKVVAVIHGSKYF